jgi:uncharacterized spore protein YtfJ
VDVYEVVDQAREVVTVRRVYGDPYEKDGVMIIPAARESSLKRA